MASLKGNLLSSELGTDENGYSLFIDTGLKRSQKTLVAEGTFPQSGGSDVTIQIYFKFHDPDNATPCYIDMVEGEVASIPRVGKIILFEGFPGVQYGVRVLDSDGNPVTDTIFSNFNLSLV